MAVIIKEQEKRNEDFLLHFQVVILGVRGRESYN